MEACCGREGSFNWLAGPRGTVMENGFQGNHGKRGKTYMALHPRTWEMRHSSHGLAPLFRLVLGRPVMVVWLWLKWPGNPHSIARPDAARCGSGILSMHGLVPQGLSYAMEFSHRRWGTESADCLLRVCPVPGEKPWKR